MKTAKKKIITSLEKLSPEKLELLKEQYPNGWSEKMTRVPKADGSYFFAILLETEDISYLVKVPVKVDAKPENEDEFFDELFNVKAKDDDNEQSADNIPDENEEEE